MNIGHRKKPRNSSLPFTHPSSQNKKNLVPPTHGPSSGLAPFPVPRGCKNGIRSPCAIYLKLAFTFNGQISLLQWPRRLSKKISKFSKFYLEKFTKNAENFDFLFSEFPKIDF